MEPIRRIGQSIMRRFWIILPTAVALVASPAFAGKLDSAKQAAKTFIAKKETGGVSHGKASQFLGKGTKILGK